MGAMYFFPVGGEEVVKALAGAVVELMEIGVGVGEDQVVLGGGAAEDLEGHVGAVVGHALQVDEQLQELGALLDGAGAGLEPLDVAVFQLVPQEVHHLFQGFHLEGQRPGAVGVALQGLVQGLAHRVGEGGELPPGGRP